MPSTKPKRNANFLIGAKLQQLRNEKNIKQEAVAKKLAVSNSFISKLENGKINISITMLLSYCEVINENYIEVLKSLTINY